MTENTKHIIYPDNQFGEIDCYQDKVLGSGAYGSVIYCKDKKNGKAKVLKTSHVTMDREKVFLDKTKSIPPSSWVQMYPVKYIVRNEMAMDYMNHTLNTQIPIEQTDVLMVANELVNQLDDFHSKTGFTHNDIKPDNIGWTVTDDLRLQIKFIDLGSVAHSSETNLDGVGTTMMYTSPLTDLSTHEYIMIADKWALGCTIFEMVCKFQDDDANRNPADHKLFYGSHIKNPLVSIRLIMNMPKINLEYILGLEETYDDSKHDLKQYLNPKRKLFNKSICGQLIYKLMLPAYSHITGGGNIKPKKNVGKKDSKMKNTASREVEKQKNKKIKKIKK